jgi:hypothetical protein
VGVKYAEGFLSRTMIGFKSFDSILQNNT